MESVFATGLRSAARSPSRLAYLRGALLVLGTGVLFGTISTLTNLAGREGMSSSTFTTLRALIGVLGLSVVVAWNAEDWSWSSTPTRQRIALLIAATANGLTNLALFASYGLMAVAFAVAIYFSYPVLVTVMSVWLGRERLTGARIAGVVITLGGLLLVLLSRASGAASLSALGLACAGAAAASQAVYFVVSRAGYPSVPPERAIRIILLVGGLISLAVVAVLGELSPGGLRWVGSPAAWLIALAGGIGTAAVAKVWLLRGIRVVGATRAATLMTSEPLLGVVLAAVVLGQPVTALVAIGGCCVVVGVLLSQRPAAGAKPVTSPAR